ncbi:hypothetical protein N7517_006641 [Penicillium concentricum]|uniref:Fungal N-terminal domain-containing protein n=1 Tax=Penicillium concentricum TaxID=293559 RepID=A0A9W9VCM6_9EURO|nr:uncharacterized protein N7517_006641 [Penicillium concentricum]KAJ5374635.1 hypothetical protein N7517_006641 [Penicillium concentricum]
MEVAGLAFAAFSLFSELEACGKSLCRFSRDIRMAKKEVKLLKYEIANCRVLASIFEEVISPIQNNVMRIAREKNLDQRLRDQSKLAHDQIREITHKLKPLHRGKSTGFQKFRAQIRWHFTKDDFQFPMATLESVKSSLGLLASLSVLDSAIADFARVPNSDSIRMSQALEKITALKKQTRRTERQFSDSMRVLHEQNRLDGHPDSAGNIRVITIIIKEIKNGTVKDAQDLVERFSNQSQVKPPTGLDVSSQLTSADDMYSPSPGLVRIRTTQHASGPKNPSIRSRSFTRDSIRTPAKELTPVGSELGRGKLARIAQALLVIATRLWLRLGPNFLFPMPSMRQPRTLRIPPAHREAYTNQCPLSMILTCGRGRYEAVIEVKGENENDKRDLRDC